MDQLTISLNIVGTYFCLYSNSLIHLIDSGIVSNHHSLYVTTLRVTGQVAWLLAVGMKPKPGERVCVYEQRRRRRFISFVCIDRRRSVDPVLLAHAATALRAYKLTHLWCGPLQASSFCLLELLIWL